MSENLTITKDAAIRIYKTVTKPQKAVLEKLFGLDTFAGNIMDRVKTFSDACKITGDDMAKVLPYSKPKNMEERVLNTYCMLRIIAKALRGTWEPDWSNTSQYKYYAWFNVIVDKKAPSGFGLSFSAYDGTGANTDVGSRLCFPTAELAKFFGEQFIDLHSIVLTN